MRKKLTLLSGLTAAMLFFYPFVTSTYADELTSTTNAETTVTTPGSTDETATTTEPQGSADETATTAEPQGSTDETATTAEQQGSADETAITTEPQGSTDETATTSEPQDSTNITANTDDPASTDPSTNGQTTSSDGTIPDENNESGMIGDLNDFYFDSPVISNGTTTNDGLVFDYSDHPESVFGLWFSFSEDDVNLLKQTSQNPKVIVKKGDVTASLPLDILPTDPSYKGFEFDIVQDSQTYANSLSPVYDFSISYMDFKEFNPFNSSIQYVQEFADNPVLLTFKIDPANVKNWDDVQVKSVDYDGTFQNEPVEIESINKETGDITAKVLNFNFNEYGVFEIAPGTESDNSGSTSTDDPYPNDPPTSTDENNSDDGSGSVGDFNDFYFDSPVISNGTTTNDGVVFDYSDHPESVFGLWFSFSEDDVNLLKQTNPNPKVIVKKGDINASLPLAILPTDPTYQGFEFDIVKDSETYENSLSPVYNFSISYMDFTNFNPFDLNLQLVQDFADNPVLLTFKIDPASVKNWDDVQVKSVDLDGAFENDPIEIESINKETGEITAKVLNFNFNGYGVFEIASDSTNNDNGSTGSSQDDDSTGTDTTGTDTTGTDTTGTDTTGTDTTGTDGSNSISQGTITNDGVVFDYSNQTDSLALSFNLSPEDVDLLKNASSKPSVIVDKGDIKISLPLSGLPTDPSGSDSILPFGINVGIDSNAYPNSLSHVYSFSLPYTDPQSGQQQYQHDFSKNPVLLTFKIDPNKVKNWDDVKVKYIDDDGVLQDEPIEIVSVNKETGEITAKVLHFSKYGVFEIASTTAPTGNSQTDVPATDENQTTGDTPATSTVVTSENPVKADVSATSLPNTASNSYNILMLGLSLIAIGGILLSFRKRNLKQSK